MLHSGWKGAGRSRCKQDAVHLLAPSARNTIHQGQKIASPMPPVGSQGVDLVPCLLDSLNCTSTDAFHVGLLGPLDTTPMTCSLLSVMGTDALQKYISMLLAGADTLYVPFTKRLQLPSFSEARTRPKEVGEVKNLAAAAHIICTLICALGVPPAICTELGVNRSGLVGHAYSPPTRPPCNGPVA